MTAELHVWSRPYEKWGTGQQEPRMPLASNSQDGAAHPLQGEGPLSERHREGHAGTGAETLTRAQSLADWEPEVPFKSS